MGGGLAVTCSPWKWWDTSRKWLDTNREWLDICKEKLIGYN